MRAFILVRAKTGREIEIKKELDKIKQINDIHVVTGPYDLLVDVKVENERELKTITIDRIRRWESVSETITLIKLP